MTDLKGLATGIGSLPHKDTQAALDLIFKYVPAIPFWPQLPKRDIREGMVAQFSQNLPCIKLTKEGLTFDVTNKDQELERFYERVIAEDSDYFKVAQDYAPGLYDFYARLEKINLKSVSFIKCQVTGPFTFAASLKDSNGVALLHDPVFLQAIAKGIFMKALWQVKFFEKFGKDIIMFIDEPYLGCFGSAYTPVNREDVIRVLSELIGDLKSRCSGIKIGVHCCGNTDWSIFTDTKGIDIINFDASGFLERLILYADNLKSFLKEDRTLCWGIVPTQDFNGNETPDDLANRVKAGIEALARKGLSRGSVTKNLLLSPACGLGTLDMPKAEAIFKLLSETAKAIKDII